MILLILQAITLGMLMLLYGIRHKIDHKLITASARTDERQGLVLAARSSSKAESLSRGVQATAFRHRNRASKIGDFQLGRNICGSQDRSFFRCAGQRVRANF